MYFSRPSKLNVNIIFLTKRGSSFLPKNTLMQLHHIRGIKYLWSYLLLATYFSSSTLYMYLIQIFRSISSILSLEAINLCPCSHDITSAILVSNTNPVGVELFSYLNIFSSWQHEGKLSIVVKHKIESRAKQIKTKTYTQNQQNLMGTHTKCDWSFAI